MLAFDDRTGNVLTTIALFAGAGAVAFAARDVLGVFVLALLLAYLLEPLVAWLERLLPGRSSSRGNAIAVVYASGLLLAVGGGYALEPTVAGQVRQLYQGAPEVLAQISGQESFTPDLNALEDTGERAISAVTAVASNLGWLLMVPLIAILLLNNRAALMDGAIDVLARRRDRTSVKRTVEKIDTMLAQYTRAQLTLAGLSAAFYTVSMALLGFPYPLALGMVSGALELIPIVGWMLAAAIMLTTGWFAHAPWLWMGVLIGAWKVIQSFVLSPRIMGDLLQLKPITIIFALMVGSAVGGLLGVLLSVPAVAVLKIIWLERSASDHALAPPALSPSPAIPNS